MLDSLKRMAAHIVAVLIIFVIVFVICLVCVPPKVW